MLTDAQMMSTICRDRRQQPENGKPSVRGVNSISSDLDKLLGPKSLDDLEKLEKQITVKLNSNESIDTDYWEHLLSSLLTYKARAKLRNVSHSMVEARMTSLRKEQAAAATALQSRLEAQPKGTSLGNPFNIQQSQIDGLGGAERHSLDPEPYLRLREEDKKLEAVDTAEFAKDLTEARHRISSLAYVANRKRTRGLNRDRDSEPASKRLRTDGETGITQASTSMFDREVARGLNDNEEIFTAEEEVETKHKSEWAQNYRPRKPRYFNRIITGYEWNKYNQTHYDHENPPPKTIQGYKFNIFYPDLVDKTKAPTYRIERENGRRRGQTFAPAGENDTCLIRFMAGPPYEDIAFRIVDREWDYSAKRERGFKSSFDKVCYCATRSA